jgi:hypothetical protein
MKAADSDLRMRKQAVNNTTAWLAAFGPPLSGFVAFAVGTVLWGDPDNWTGARAYVLFILRVAVMDVLMRVDRWSLRRQGFDPQALGIASPNNLPLYLFTRARAFGQSQAYALTWCVLLALNVLVEVI